MMLLLSTTPKVQDPEVIVHKYDNFDFGNVNLSLHGLNTVEMNKEVYEGKRLQIESDGSWNINTKEQEATLQVSWRFK
jgi:hypothetical protein